MRRLRRYPITMFAAATIAAITLSGLASWWARAQPTSIGPWTTVTSVTTGAAVQIGALNPTRRSFTICDNSATGGVYILPALTPGGAAVNPTTTQGIFLAANACFSPPANLLASGNAAGGAQAWNAIAVSNTSIVSFTEW